MIESVGLIIKQIEGIGSALGGVSTDLGDIASMLTKAKDTANELKDLVSGGSSDNSNDNGGANLTEKQAKRLKKTENKALTNAKQKAKDKAVQIWEDFKKKFASIPSEIAGTFSSIMPTATEYMMGKKDDIEKFAEAASNVSTDMKAVVTAASAFAKRMAMIPTAIIGTCPIGPTIQAAAIPKELAQLKSDGDNLNTACTKALISVGVLKSQTISASESISSIIENISKIKESITSVKTAVSTIESVIPGLGLSSALDSVITVAEKTLTSTKELVKSSQSLFEGVVGVPPEYNSGVISIIETTLATLQKIPAIVGSLPQSLPTISFTKSAGKKTVENSEGQQVEVETKSISVVLGPVSKEFSMERDPDSGKWIIPFGAIAGMAAEVSSAGLSELQTSASSSSEDAEGKAGESSNYSREAILKSPRRVCKSCSGYGFNSLYFENYYGIVGDKKRIFDNYVLKGTSPMYSSDPGSDYQIYLGVKSDYDTCKENHLCCGKINWMEDTRKSDKTSQNNTPDDLDLYYPKEMGSSFPTKWSIGDELPATLCNNFK